MQRPAFLLIIDRRTASHAPYCADEHIFSREQLINEAHDAGIRGRGCDETNFR